MGQPDVGELVRAATAGDQSSWDELVDRFTGLVWHVARGHRLGEADAADVVQTVWLRLVESLPRLREPAAVAGWLATTARHESLRLLRRAGREVSDEELALR
ncbi:MAG: RNA polymerase sigma factor, partial [Actinomycetes bacterium]